MYSKINHLKAGINNLILAFLTACNLNNLLPTAVLQNCGRSANLKIVLLLRMITKLKIIHQNHHLRKAADRCVQCRETSQTENIKLIKNT
jgi:hypothetical protein